MAGRKWTPAALRAEADRLERRAGRGPLYTFSHGVMAGIMAVYFAGAALGVYMTVARGEPLSVTLEYIMTLAKIVAPAYLVKAFGENIAKIVLPALHGTAHTEKGYDEDGQ
jgi:hypothetical protein